MMRFGPVTSSLALIGGMTAAGLQGLSLLVLLIKTVSEFDIPSLFSLLFLLMLAVGAFMGPWLLQRSAEFSYFVLFITAGFFLVAAGFIGLPTIGPFLLPGGVAIVLTALGFLMSSDDRVPLWRKLGIVVCGSLVILMFAAQLYGIVYLIYGPVLKDKAPGSLERTLSHRK